MEDSLLQSNAPVEVAVPIRPKLEDDRGSGIQATGSGGNPVNKFLLCTLVCEMAREIKARAAQSGRSLPLLRIVRDVLHSLLEEASGDSELSATGHLLNEEALKSEIERRLQDYLKQSQELRIESTRPDPESIMAGDAAKRNRGVFRRG